MAHKITYKPYGNKAILIEWPSIISKEILKDILLFKSKIEKENNFFLEDLIVGYASLTLTYKKEFINFSEEIVSLKNIYQSNFNIQKQNNYLWTIPVCYDLDFGVDLEEISKKLSIHVEGIIQLHTNEIYTVFFIGFLPGFLYLGGLHEQLFFDRKPNPRLKVEKGSVAIGGKQTGVYPFNSPGGWNIIGKTPIQFFNVKNENPCFAKAGDAIQFQAISKEKFYRIENEVAQNSYCLLKTLLDD